MEQHLIDQFVKDQVEKWKHRDAERTADDRLRYSVITLGMEPGSGGRVVAERLARCLDLDFFHRDILQGIADSTHMSSQVIDSLEKERLSGVEDFISSLIKEKYLYPGTYLRHLMKVVGAIARHGRAVIVGRGANFILPADKRFSVRVICPLEDRVKNVAREFGVSLDDARKRVMRRESRRRAFVRQSFNADISDPLHYQMILNTGSMTVDSAVEAVAAAVRVRRTCE
jgi:cytidylate kinase